MMSLKNILKKRKKTTKGCLVNILLVSCILVAFYGIPSPIKSIRDVVGVFTEGYQEEVCYFKLTQIQKAFHDYDQYWGCLPPVWSSPKNSPEIKLHSWRVLLLPFLGKTDLYHKIRLDEPWDSEWNKQFHNQCPSVYQCPRIGNKAIEKGETSYRLFYGPNGLFRGNYSLSFNVFTEKVLDDSFPWSLYGICYLIEQKKTVNWMNPEGDILLSDNIFKKDRSLKSRYFLPCHYTQHTTRGLYGWSYAFSTSGVIGIDEPPGSIQKGLFEITDEMLRKPEDIDDLSRFYKIKTKLYDPMRPLPQELYLVGFTAKGVQVMGEAKIRYTVSRERFDPEEKEYLNEQYKKEYQYYRDYLLIMESWNLPNLKEKIEIPSPSSEKVEIKFKTENVRRIFVPAIGETRGYGLDEVDEWRRKNANQ